MSHALGRDSERWEGSFTRAVLRSLLLILALATSGLGIADASERARARLPVVAHGPAEQVTTPDHDKVVGAAVPTAAPAAVTTEVTPARAAPQARAIARGSPEEPAAEWLPATGYNYERGRRGSPVQYVVIHYTAISYERTLKAFRLPSSRVSAHYVIRADGHVAQMVSENDTAWHAGHYWYNLHSVGIELEIDAVTNKDFTAAQYKAAAAIACGVSARHRMPLTRGNVVGHNEIPGTGKIDPGPTWSWPHFMWLTTLCAPPNAGTLSSRWVAQSEAPEVVAGEDAQVTVTLRNTGTIAWRKGGSTEARLGVVGEVPKALASGWPLHDRAAVQAEDLVPPGGNATFTFSVKGALPGSYVLRLRPVVDGAKWMEDQGIHTVITVKPSAARGTPAP